MGGTGASPTTRPVERWLLALEASFEWWCDYAGLCRRTWQDRLASARRASPSLTDHAPGGGMVADANLHSPSGSLGGEDEKRAIYSGFCGPGICARISRRSEVPHHLYRYKASPDAAADGSARSGGLASGTLEGRGHEPTYKRHGGTGLNKRRDATKNRLNISLSLSSSRSAPRSPAAP